MNLLSFALFTFQLLLETFILPNNPISMFSPNFFNFMASILIVYIASSELKKMNKSIIFLIFLANIFFKNYLVDYYYPHIPQTEVFFELIITTSVFLSLIFTKEKDYLEIDDSKIIPHIKKFVCSFIFANSLSFYFKDFTFNGIKENESYGFLIQNKERIFADFIILHGIFVICDLVNYNERKDKAYIKNIFKWFVFNTIVTLIYFISRDKFISGKIYDLVFHHIPMPYNIILYNTFAYIPEIKFKVGFAFAFYLF